VVVLELGVDGAVLRSACVPEIEVGHRRARLQRLTAGERVGAVCVGTPGAAWARRAVVDVRLSRVMNAGSAAEAAPQGPVKRAAVVRGRLLQNQNHIDQPKEETS